VLLAIGNDGQFARFCAAIGEEAWAQDARFATNTARVRNRAALLELMKPQMRQRSTADWIALLEDKAVPC
ncbi:CoA transferase, partial [Streptococcus suis]